MVLTTNKWMIVGLLAPALLLCGCDSQNTQTQSEEERLGRYGMLEQSSPEYTAVNFLKAIYNDTNLEQALDLAAPKLARVMHSYRTNRNVQRNLLNLRYDTVTISLEGTQSPGLEEFAEKSTVLLRLSGMYDGDKIDDIRLLDLQRIDGEWRVLKVYQDPVF